MLPCGGKSAISHQSPPKILLSLFHSTNTLPLIQQLHAQIIINGFHRWVLFGSNLAHAYSESGSLQFASKAFEQIKHKNIHSWNTIISAYSKQKLDSNVLQLFKRLRNNKNVVDNFNLVFAIKACVGLSDLRDGKMVHSLGIKIGLCAFPFVGHELVDMYVKLGSCGDAQKVFDECPERDLVTCGIMLKGYLKFSEEYKVFEMFSKMRSSGMELVAFTFETLVRTCGNVFAGTQGKACHGLCVKLNFIGSSISLQTSFVESYLKCGFFDLAIKLFEEVPEKDVVLWSALIAGFAKTSEATKGIRFFKRMLEETSIFPNSVILASVVLACSQMGSLRQGKSVHCYMLRNGLEFDVVNYTSFIDMYAKCGCIAIANKVFNQAPYKNVFCWSAMINGFGIHGMYSEAIDVFDRMQLENQVPNSVTFISVLSACSHSGRVEEGWKYFKSMSTNYGISPKVEHYACMVDLLGRAGKIDEALSFIKCMPINPGASSWGALLSACRIHKLVELAEEVAKKLLPLETDKSAVYVLLSNIYADVGMWDMVKKLRFEIGKKGLHKYAGFTSVEVENTLYVFDSKDRLACRNTQIVGVWISLCQQMMELGYKLDTSFVE